MFAGGILDAGAAMTCDSDAGLDISKWAAWRPARRWVVLYLLGLAVVSSALFLPLEWLVFVGAGLFDPRYENLERIKEGIPREEAQTLLGSAPDVVNIDLHRGMHETEEWRGTRGLIIVHYRHPIGKDGWPTGVWVVSRTEWRR